MQHAPPKIALFEESTMFHPADRYNLALFRQPGLLALAAFLLLLVEPVMASAQDVTYGPWRENKEKGYYYRECKFPKGGYQYLIYYKVKPEWVYWYNPKKEVFWSVCPTSRHPVFGDRIKKGEDLFLIATHKDKKLSNTQFALNPNLMDFNQKPTTAEDADGSTVKLGCPPDDLP